MRAYAVRVFGRRTVAAACLLVLIACVVWWLRTERSDALGEADGSGASAARGAEVDQLAGLEGSAKTVNEDATVITPPSPTLPPAHPGRLEILGIVVDEAGRPVEGAAVQLQQGVKGDGWLRNTVLWGNVARLVTPEDGTFRLPAARDNQQRRLWVERSKQWSGTTVVIIDDIDAPLTLTVQRAPNLGGILLDPKGRRLRHGTVHVSYEEMSKAGTVMADRDGAFKIRIPVDATNIRLQLGHTEQWKRKKGEPLGTVLYDVPIGSMDLVLRLLAEVFIRGVVEGVDGAHPTSATIYAKREDEGPQAVQLAVGIQGGEGAFVVGPLRPGRWKLVAQPSDAHYAMSEWTHAVAPAEDVVITCEVTDGIHGRVEGDDVAGFRVVWRDENTPLGPRASSVTVGKDGAFHVPHVRNAPHAIYVTKRGDSRMARLRGVRPGPEPLVIRLERGLALEGSFQSGAKQMGRRVIAAQGGFEVDALADGNGYFRILGLVAGDWQLDAVTKSENMEWKSGPGIIVPAGSRGVVIEE